MNPSNTMEETRDEGHCLDLSIIVVYIDRAFRCVEGVYQDRLEKSLARH